MNTTTSFFILYVVTLLKVPIINGFSFPLKSFHSSSPWNQTGEKYARTQRQRQLNMIADPIVPSEPSKKMLDKNGVEFTPECIVQTCTEIRAFHVSKKGFGSFDQESKSFVGFNVSEKNTGEIPRADRCLIIPEGMRGKVRRVYDMDEFDATAPIVARFEADDSLDGEYAPPVTFMMHFQIDEVEVV